MSALSHVFKKLFFFCVSTPVVLPLHVDIILFSKSFRIVLDQCIAASRGVQLWYMLVMEYYCAQRNNELVEFHVNCNDLQELMQSERRRTKRSLYTEADTLW